MTILVSHQAVPPHFTTNCAHGCTVLHRSEVMVLMRRTLFFYL